MTELERIQHISALTLFYQQLHLTVVYENDFMKRLGSQKKMLLYRDEILDRINNRRRILGYI